MADTDRIKRNLTKMIDQGAPEADLNSYLATEGFKSPEEWKAAIGPKPPAQGSIGGDVLDAVNTGVNWLGTQATKAVTGLAGAPRGVADLQRSMVKGVGGSDATAMAVNALNPLTAAGQFLPSSASLNNVVFGKFGVPEANLPGRAGHVIDATTQGALSALAGPGNFLRNVVPAAVGGGLQETAGGAEGIKGTRWEPVMRLLTGLGGGVGTAAIQNAGGNVLRGVGNTIGTSQSNTDAQAARILGRALENDQTTAGNMLTQYGERGPGAMLIEAGGENAKGALRGSTAAPGPARTTVRNAFDQRLENEPSQTAAAINARVSDKPPISTRVNALDAGRTAAARPAYQTAGIPDRVLTTEATTQGPATTRSSAVLGPDGQPMQITEPGKSVVTKTFNTPNFSSPALDKLIKESPDVQTAMNAARRLPEFRELPNDSMALLDKAYKHLNGMEQEAVRAGNGTRAHDLSHLRTDFKNALTEANPAYGEALAAYAGPSKLIDAAEQGRKLFSSNVHPEEVARQYQKLPPDARTEFLGGVADYLRTKAGNSERGVAAERIWGGENNRQRLQAILPPEDFAALAKQMENTRNAVRTIRDVGQGSRTTPRMLEAADNIGGDTGNALVKAMRGHPLGAALDVGNALIGRVAEGRNQAVNNRLAEMLTTMKPEEAKAFLDAAERARLSYAKATAGRRNALSVGALYPAIGAASGASP